MPNIEPVCHSVWVTGTAKRVAEAARKGGFARGFKAPTTVSPTLVEDIRELLDRDALQALSIANKAGLATSGFSKTESALRSHAASVLLEASDAAVDGRGKLERIYARTAGGGGVLTGLFDSTQLGLALGRPHVIHAALARGAATDAFVARCRKLAQFRGVALDGKALETKE